MDFANISFFSSLIAFTQTLKTDDGLLHWEASFLAGLNTDGYLFDFGIAYYPIQYIGVNLSFSHIV